MSKYPALFSPIRLGAHTIKNRMVMSSVATLLCNEDGSINDSTIAHYERRARGGVGLICLEFTAVDPVENLGAARQIHLGSEAAIPGFSAIADAVHPYGTKVIAQLHHAGDRGFKRPGDVFVGPSENEKLGTKALTKEEIKALVQKFAAAAKRAKKAGLDGIEIHAGHGYLISNFISPLTNQREDEYGGSVENRARFAMEIIAAIRAACGPEFLMSIRLTVMDWDPRGMTIEEGIETAKLIDAMGAVDLINLTVGHRHGHINAIESQERPEGVRVFIAEKIKPHVKTPVAIAGKLRSGEMCNDIIAQGVTDMVAIGRQYLADPSFSNKLKAGQDETVRPCISCMECFSSLPFRRVRCAVNPAMGFDHMLDEENLAPAKTKKNIVVVGGGLSGMQAAITCAQRGHTVTLLEKSEHLGGQLNIAQVPPGKGVLNKLVAYFSKQLELEGVAVTLGTTADTQTVLALKPDFVFLAIGAEPAAAPISGFEHTTGAWDVLNGKLALPQGKNIVVIGGGIVGCETALYLQEAGNQLTILELLPTVSAGQDGTHRLRDKKAMADGGMQVLTQALVQKITPSSVTYLDAEGKEHSITADLILSATGQKPLGSDMDAALEAAGVEVQRLGDATDQGGTFYRAIRSGFVQALTV